MVAGEPMQWQDWTLWSVNEGLVVAAGVIGVWIFFLNDADACVGVGLWPRQYHKGPEGGRGSARQDCDNRVAVDTHYISPWVDCSTQDSRGTIRVFPENGGGIP